MTQDLLTQDLHSESRDPLYRAVVYLQARGAPVPDPAPSEMASLVRLRDSLLGWLKQRPDLEALTGDYVRFRNTWGPIFSD